MLYRDELEALAATAANVRLVRVFTEEPGRGDLDGFLTAAHLEATEPGWAEAEAFVCGPAPLMDSARELFARVGRDDHLHTEAFTLAQFTAEAGNVDGTVRFGASEIGVASDGRPLLIQAEAAGLAPLSGCRMGICHTCTRRLCAGCLLYTSGPAQGCWRDGASSTSPISSPTPAGSCRSTPSGPDGTLSLIHI